MCVWYAKHLATWTEALLYARAWGAILTVAPLTTYLLWRQAPLTLAVKEGFNLLFRNLDATATLLRTVELRGKTIQNVSTCTGYSMMGPVR